MDKSSTKRRKMSKKRRELIKRRRIRRRIFTFTVLGVCLFFCTSLLIKKVFYARKIIQAKESIEQNITIQNTHKDDVIEKKEILISIAGDTTLGTDDTFIYETSLPAVFKNNGSNYSYFMQNVKHIFAEDDYTILNLETTLTDSTTKSPKGGNVFFHFKGPKDYVNILTSSSIEGVTIANNHVYDYGTQGFNDTVQALQNNNVDICGEEYKIIREIKGIKFGFLGYTAWDASAEIKNKITNDIASLRNEGVEIIIPYFHWGIEKAYEPTNYQIELARFCIDNGADTVIGSHPHVMQTMEKYKGKLIAYSMGNFCFGGNSNPSDKRTFVLQIKYTFENDTLMNTEFKVIPTMISSQNNINDYIPTVAKDSRQGILDTLNSLSPTLNGNIIDSFFTLEN